MNIESAFLAITTLDHNAMNYGIEQLLVKENLPLFVKHLAVAPGHEPLWGHLPSSPASHIVLECL